MFMMDVGLRFSFLVAYLSRFGSKTVLVSLNKLRDIPIFLVSRKSLY